VQEELAESIFKAIETTLKVDAASSSETPVINCQSTGRLIPE